MPPCSCQFGTCHASVYCDMKGNLGCREGGTKRPRCETLQWDASQAWQYGALDMLVASDVCYDPDLLEPLLQVISNFYNSNPALLV